MANNLILQSFGDSFQRISVQTDGDLVEIYGIMEYVKVFLPLHIEHSHGARIFSILNCAQKGVPIHTFTIIVLPNRTIVVANYHILFRQQCARYYPRANSTNVSIMVPVSRKFVMISPDILAKKQYTYAINIGCMFDEAFSDICACFLSYVQYQTSPYVHRIWTPTNVHKPRVDEDMLTCQIV